MSPKPGDLLLSVIDFFGILIPGAVMLYLHGNLILGPLGISIGPLSTIEGWAPALLISFVLGHFLLGLSVPLNRPAGWRPPKETDAYYESVRAHVPVPTLVPRSRSTVYYSAYSFIRINSPAALAEIERQAAEYKLFRSLTLLFFLDIGISAVSGSLTPARLGFGLLAIVLAAYRFRFLFQWTYKLVFDFYWQLSQTKRPT